VILNEKYQEIFNEHQLILARRQQHSKKPEEAMERLGEFFKPEIRKIELFARQTRLGWDCWGNETDKFQE